MSVKSKIDKYFNTLPAKKQEELKFIHQEILNLYPDCHLWFLDGKNEDGKVVANPNIGYGKYNIQYADGSSKEFYRVGLSANTTGISIYIMGLPDKHYLIDNFSSRLGKAKITSYCIKFKKMKDIDLLVLNEIFTLFK